jgi:hypothetical protein
VVRVLAAEDGDDPFGRGLLAGDEAFGAELDGMESQECGSEEDAKVGDSRCRWPGRSSGRGCRRR